MLLGTAGAGAWAWLGQPAAVPIRVAVASKVAADAGPTAGASLLDASGYVVVRRQATVSAKITGKVTEVLIEEGQHVERDQVVGRLDDSNTRAALDQAQAQVKQAEAQLRSARTSFADARPIYERSQKQSAAGLVSIDSFDNVKSGYDAQQTAVDVAEQALAVATANLVVAQRNEDDTVVKAPFAGVITVKAAQPGEIVSPISAGGGFTRTGIGTIVDMESLEVDVDVNEAYIGKVKANMPAEAVLDAYSDWKIPAHVIAIVPTADRGKATIKVRMALEHKDARIVPDMGVRVSFLDVKPQATTQAPQGVLVPATAIVQRDGRSVVFVLDRVASGQRDKVRQRAVTPATQAYGDLRLLPAAVASGDSVVIAPPPELHDGSDIEIKPASP